VTEDEPVQPAAPQGMSSQAR